VWTPNEHAIALFDFAAICDIRANISCIIRLWWVRHFCAHMPALPPLHAPRVEIFPDAS
jgi:hypothetical protein